MYDPPDPRMCSDSQSPLIEASLPAGEHQRDAIIAALNINTFARHAGRVRMANIAQMVNVLQAMLLTDREKLVKTPTHHVFRIYVPFQDATFVPVQLDAQTYVHGAIELRRVDAIAASDRDGTVWLAVTNVDPRRAVRVRIAGDQKSEAIRGETLAAPHRTRSCRDRLRPGEPAAH